MGALIQIGIYAAIAAAAWFAFHSWENSLRAEGATKQLAADKPIIDACKIDRDTAVKANVSLQADVSRIAGERDEQNKQVQSLADQLKAQKTRQAQMLAAAKPRIDALRVETGTLEERLAANEEGKTCDEKLANVDRDLRASVGGVRSGTTAPASDKRSPQPAARPSAGRGTLRLSQ